MLGTSLSAVAAFAAFTLYVIASDEVAANRQKSVGNKKPEGQSDLPKSTVAPLTSESVQTEKPKPVQRRSRASKTTAANDPVNVAASAILEYVSTNGPITLNKLSQELKMEKETVQLASEKLIADNALASIKRGGYPALAPI